MHDLVKVTVFAAALCLSGLLASNPADAAVQVTVGNHPSCDFTSIRDAIGNPGQLLDLEILVQGQGAEGSPGQQGIHDAYLDITGPRSVAIVGDDGSAPLSTCTGSNSSRRPVIQGLGPSDSRYKLVVKDGATVVLNNIDVEGTFAGGVQVTDSHLSVNGVDFRNNITPGGVSGAAIQADSSDVELEDAGFFGNVSPAAGGAIFCTADTFATITASNVRFGSSSSNSGNRAGFDGGAVAFLRNCVFEGIGGVVFEGNSAGRDGGAIAAAADDVNRIDLRADVVFGGTQGNAAGRNGGAISLGAEAELLTEDSLSIFSRNSAQDAGGALYLAGAGSRAILLGCDNFVENEAGIGGAIYTEGIVRVRNRERVLLCEPTLDLPADQYQTMFESNVSTEGAGGVIYATGGNASVSFEQVALIGNDASVPRDFVPPLGSVAYVDNGAELFIHNSLIWANGSQPASLFRDPPTLLQADDTGSRIDIGLTTIVENIGAHTLLVNPGASARLYGVIDFNNDMLAPSSGGTRILSVCSTLDTGIDPGFIAAPGSHRGRFRLAPGSFMRGFCSASDAPFLMDLTRDLDDVRRSQRAFGDTVHFDAGAFNGNSILSVFARCTIEDDQLGLGISMSGDGTSFNVTGNGPNLPATTNKGLIFLPDDGTGGWTDVRVDENSGDRETLFVGDVSCLTAVLTVITSGPGAVISDPSGIDCPGDCRHAFAPGESVSLAAFPDEGAVFAGWSEPGCGLETVCIVTLQEARTMSASFESADSIFNDGFE